MTLKLNKKILLLLLLSGCARSNIIDPLDLNWQNVKSRQAFSNFGGAPSAGAIKKVNNELKDFKYERDINIYGVDDYWATPHEMEKKKAGDCEDFVIYAYYELIKEGFTEDELNIAIVQQPIWANENHAILLIRYNKEVYVLDNKIPIVTTWDKVKNQYQIIKRIK